MSSDRISLLDRDFQSGTSIDLGAGRTPRNPFRMQRLIALDLQLPQEVSTNEIEFVTCDVVNSGLPFDDESVDCVTAFDFFEHIPRLMYVDRIATYPFISLMNEIHRVLKPRGVLLAVTPAFPRQGAFVDPTHVNFITRDTVSYFSDECHARTLGYGFEGTFSTLHNDWLPYTSKVWRTVDTPRYRAKTGVKNSALGERRFSKRSGTLADRLRGMSGASATDHLMWLLEKNSD
jgi:SAM-dependent methyltransferase